MYESFVLTFWVNVEAENVEEVLIRGEKSSVIDFHDLLS